MSTAKSWHFKCIIPSTLLLLKRGNEKIVKKSIIGIEGILDSENDEKLNSERESRKS